MLFRSEVHLLFVNNGVARGLDQFDPFVHYVSLDDILGSRVLKGLSDVRRVVLITDYLIYKAM